jgi:hypothetical protein
MRYARFWIVAFSGLSTVTFAGQPLTTCSSVALSKWTTAWASMGVATDNQDDILGTRSARKFGLSNWYPVDGSKHSICGVMDRWSLFYGQPWFPNERDVHIHVIPSKTFDFALANLPLPARRDLDTCNGSSGTSCIFGEVTPPDDFTTWLYAPKVLPNPTPSGDCDSCSVDKYVRRPDDGDSGSICAYGPWVLERVHDLRPELHPIEQFWAPTRGRVTTAAPGAVDLYFIADASGRFSKADGFSKGLANGEPAGWREWAPDQMPGVAGLAYRASAGEGVTLSVSPLFPPIAVDTTPKQGSHVWHDGSSTVELAAPAWIDTAHEACVDPRDSSKTLGIVWIKTLLRRAVGNQAPDRSGAALGLQIERSQGSELPPPVDLQPTSNVAPPYTAVAGPVRAAAAACAVPTDPEIKLDVLSVENKSDATQSLTLPLTSAFWGIGDYSARSIEWRLSRAQTMWTQASYVGHSPQGEVTAAKLNDQQEKDPSRPADGPISIDWTFSVQALDVAQDMHFSIGDSPGLFRYGLELRGGQGIRTTTAEQVIGPYGLYRYPTFSGVVPPWLSMLYVQFPTLVWQVGPTFMASSVMNVSATLKDDNGWTGCFGPYALTSHAPEPAGSGWKPDEVVDDLTYWVASWIMRHGHGNLSVSDIRQALITDWGLQAPNPSIEPAQLRLARIVREWSLISLRDGDLSPEEFAEVLRLSMAYAAVKWPSAAGSMK